MPSSKSGTHRDSENSFFAAMTYPDYRYMWGAGLSAGAAAWALIVGRGWLIYEMTDSALLIGVVTYHTFLNLPDLNI